MKAAVLIFFAAAVLPAQDTAAAHLGRGSEFFRNHDYGKAVPELRRALQLQPSLMAAQRMLGEALLEQGYAQESLPYLERGGMLFLHARALVETNQLLEAIPELLAIFSKNPNDPDVLFYLGKASGSMMQQSFGRLVRLHPDSVRARELQAQSLLGQGRADLAEPQFRAMLQAAPGMAGVHLALGKILMERGDLDGAEKELRAEAQRSPGDSEAAWRLGTVLLKKGNSKDALAELQRSDKLKPEMLETLNDLGTAYQMEGRLDEAEKVFRHMIGIEDADDLAASAHLHLSQIYRKQGKNDEAAAHLKRFREMQPKEGVPPQ